MVDFDDFSDWLELYNQNAVDVDISGWTLADSYPFAVTAGSHHEAEGDAH